jgi:hypothetical protein
MLFRRVALSASYLPAGGIAAEGRALGFAGASENRTL